MAVLNTSLSISVIFTFRTSFVGGVLYSRKCARDVSNSQLLASDSKYSGCIISAICCRNNLSVNSADITLTWKPHPYSLNLSVM